MAVADLQFKNLTNNGRKFIAPHLRVNMDLYPLVLNKSNPFAPTRETAAHQINADPTSTEASVIKLQWDKQLGQPSGAWSVVLKAKHGRMPLDDLTVIDGDWVDLAVVRNGTKIPLCRGVVDSKREQKASAGGATTRRYTMTGRDHGAFFEYPLTWNNMFARTLAELSTGFMAAKLNGKTGGSPDVIFRSIVEGWFAKGADAGQWELPQSLKDAVGVGKQSLYDILKVVSFNTGPGSDSLRGASFNEQLWTIGEQTLFQTLSQWTNPVLNEMWVDLLPPKDFITPNGLSSFLDPKTKETTGESVQQLITSDEAGFGSIAAIIRERPFPTVELGDASMWFHLPTWRIPTWLLSSSDLGTGGAQRFNLFDLNAGFGLGPKQEEQALGKPRWYKNDMQTHGLRVYQQDTRFLGPKSTQNGFWFEERDQWIQLLVNWFAPNPYLLQGSVAIKTLLPEIRVGHRVILDSGNPETEIQAYVEGVSLTWEAPTEKTGAMGTTQLVLTRGFQGSDAQLMDAVTKLSSLYDRTL